MLIDRNHPPVTTHHVRTTYHHVTCFVFGHRVLKAVLHQMCDALAVATHPIKGSRSISYSARPSRGACSEASLYFTGVVFSTPTDRTVIYHCFTVSLCMGICHVAPIDLGHTIPQCRMDNVACLCFARACNVPFMFHGL